MIFLKQFVNIKIFFSQIMEIQQIDVGLKNNLRNLFNQRNFKQDS